MNKVGILYVCIGRYSIFWEEFYQTSSHYLFPNSDKHYFVFTDDDKLLKTTLPNVTFFHQEDLGWPGNVIYRYDFFYKHKESLNQMDYLYFFNGNYTFVDTIYEEEIFPDSVRNEGLMCLSWYKDVPSSCENFPYERNPESKAYIPVGEGKQYFQSGFFGGETKSVLQLVDTCKSWVDEDMAKGIIAIWHDESHINKYFIDRNPRIVGREYGKPERWEKPKNAKAILREKKRVLGRKYMYTLKGRKPKFRLWNKIISFFKR